jgi:elongation factor Ts
MANIELIKVLRDRTGAGIMDCKKALEANNDNVDKACDWLREKGIAKQAKKADRIAAEGLALVHVCEKCGKASIVEINCETDFVANSDPFRNLTDSCTKAVLTEDCKTVEDLVNATSKEFNDAAVKLGEKLSIRRFDTIVKKDGEGIGSYIHMGGKIAVLVLLKKDDAELAKGIAMHIAANNPKYIAESDIPTDVYNAELNIQKELVKNDPKLAGKPAAALENILKGKVHKVLSESVLADQEFLMSPDKTVGQMLKEKDNAVVSFIRYQVGEGIEKRVDNFAEEVMNQAK